MIDYFEKEKISLKRTIINDQSKVSGCKNRTNSMCREGDDTKTRTLARCFKEDKFFGCPYRPLSSRAKG